STCPDCQVQHIPDAIQAGIIAGRFYAAERQMAGRVRGLESRFNTAVRMYSMLIDAIYLTQQSVTLHTMNVLRGNGLDSLHDINAPCSSQLAPGVAAMNVRLFACALEGSPIDALCVGGQAVSGTQNRSRVIANVANAARGEFPKARDAYFPALMHPQQ